MVDADESLLPTTSTTGYIIVTHSAVNSPSALVVYLLQHGATQVPGLLVTTLRSAASYSSSSNSFDVLDLTSSVPGYPSLGSSSSPLSSILATYSSRLGTIVIDGIDVLAEDYGTGPAVYLVRELLALARDAPASRPRIILTLPTSSSLLPHLTSPTLSPAVTLLTPHQAAHLESLSASYLAPLGSERFRAMLETAKARAWDVDLSHRGLLGGYAYGEGSNRWNGKGGSGNSSRPDAAEVVQVLVRKATGGAKGISRSLEAIRDGAQVPLAQVARVDPLTRPQAVDVSGTAGAKTHADLNLPFNLSLTDRQREERGGVPLPYVHEGEGMDRLGAGMDWEEDEEDEEV